MEDDDADENQDNMLDALTIDVMVQSYRQAARCVDEHPCLISYLSRHLRSRPGFIIRHDAPTDVAYQAFAADGNNVWAPFESEVDWKVAKWAKLRGSSSTAFSELLGIDGVCEFE